jgi:hypothetical protein
LAGGIRAISCKDIVDGFAVDIGEAVMAPLKLVGETGVIDAEAMKQCRVEVVDVDGIAHDVVIEIVCFSMGDAAADAPASKPD